jgi:hypothetical protein
MWWVILFAALAVLALIAIAVCAWPVWKASTALLRQFGDASEAFGTSMEKLSEALDQPSMREPASRRR